MVPGQPSGASGAPPSPLSSLLSDAVNCASTGLRKPEQGVGLVPPGYDPLACLVTICLAAPLRKGSLSTPDHKRKIKFKARLKTESDVVLIFKFSLLPARLPFVEPVFAGKGRITIPEQESLKFGIFSFSREYIFPRERIFSREYACRPFIHLADIF